MKFNKINTNYSAIQQHFNDTRKQTKENSALIAFINTMINAISMDFGFRFALQTILYITIIVKRCDDTNPIVDYHKKND